MPQVHWRCLGIIEGSDLTISLHLDALLLSVALERITVERLMLALVVAALKSFGLVHTTVA